MKSGNITVTDARLLRALNTVSNAATSTTSSKGGNSEETSKGAYVGILNRFYYNSQEASVKIGDNEVFCQLTCPVAGSVDLLFTPFSELEWDADRRKTYFKPYENIKCIVLKINDKYYVISYFQENQNLPVINEGGALYLGGYNVHMQLGGTGGGVTFDSGKIIFKDWSQPEMRNKVYTDELTEENITNENYYDKTEVYTKEEVDKLIEELREELDPNTTEETDEEDTT